jgi:hypothetical protein
MENLDPLETKICGACEKPKRITRFQLLRSGNRGSVCNLCKSLGITIKNKVKAKKKLIHNHPLQLTAVFERDYVNTYEFFKAMKYSLEEDIHEQFCKRHGLTPNSPKKIFKNHLSPKDLGLV